MALATPAAHLSLSVRVEESSGVWGARRVAVALAERLQYSPSDVGRVALIVTEAATNIVQYAKHGEILLRELGPEAPGSLEVLALDRGPGIGNVAQALQDGFSTGGSAGLGLGSIARLSTSFEITSTPGKGTALLARVSGGAELPSANSPGLEWGVVCVPKHGEAVAGDAWAVASSRQRDALLVVDGLGHGPLALEAAEQALLTFRQHAEQPPESLLATLHEALRTTRGAVAAVAEIDWQRRELRYAGAGNIAGTLVPLEGRASSLLSHSGTLGSSVTRFQEFAHPWPDQGLLILHSDGLSQHWDLGAYPGLRRKHPSLIAAVLYRDFSDRRDDAVVLVARERTALSPEVNSA